MASTVASGYWPAYSYSYFPPSAVNASLFTHVFYAFALLDSQSFELTISDDNKESAAQFTSTLQTQNPSLKTLLSIGGGGGEAIKTTFATMAADATSRATFIQSSIALARQYSFHGLDLDWEYPETAAEMQNWGLLFSEWRSAVESEATSSGNPKLILTAAVYYAQKFSWGAMQEYPMDSVVANLDWVNIMSYDFYGTWTPNNTGAHAALYDPQSDTSTSYGVESWLNAGLSATKIVIGMPIYGRSWKLRSASQVGIGAPADGPGVPDYVEGTMSYSDIRKWIGDKGATEVYDETTVSAYCYSGLDWIGYDNEQSVKVKVEFAKSKGLRGYFFWNLSQDNNWALCLTAAQT